MKDDIHVYPLNDRREHVLSVNCPCKPEVEVEGAIVIVTHRAWDHRDFFEELEAFLNSERG